MADMIYEFYFTKNGTKVGSSIWMDFIESKSNNTFDSFFKKYKVLYPSHGNNKQKEVFGFNPNGEVLFMDSDGKRYKGIWFDMSNQRISVLKTGTFNGNI